VFKLAHVIASRRRLTAGVLVGIAIWLAHPLGRHGATRIILAWDGGTFAFLLLALHLFLSERINRMEQDAQAQEEGEWTVFALTLAAILLSLAAIFSAFTGLKDVPAAVRNLRIALVVVTLVLSWLMTQITFALRYAHEFYSRDPGTRIEGGLDFPGTKRPDYLDFVYFAFVLGMTFQVSDVQITSRKLRRLATLHGVVGFLFNTVILALVVNLAAGLV
jgi:uncharacterized membrane protein